MLLLRSMNGAVTDFRYALRNLRRAPAFYLLVVGFLGLGIACSVAVFSLVDGILVRPLPYSHPRRLVALTSYAIQPPFDSNGSLSYNDFLQFKATARSLSDVACTFRTGWSRVTLRRGTEPAPVQGAFVSPNLFSLFGRQPLIGRTFTDQENLEAARVVIISEGLWAQLFGSSPQAIGQDIVLGRDRWRVIGVMPSDFQVPFLDTQLWAPVRSHPEWNDRKEANPLDRARWDLMARLKPGVTFATAQAEVDSIEKGLRASLPEFHRDEVRVVPLREHFTGNVRKPLLVLGGAVVFLLLITCANVANLLLTRASHRKREIAIRYALGARHGRVVRQLAIEAIVFSLVGGVLGIVGAFSLVPLLKAISPANTPLLNSVTLDARSLIFALALSMTVGVLLGIAPARGGPSRDASEDLNSAGRNLTPDRRSRRLKNVLVAVEFAVAMVLLTGAGLLIRSMIAVLSTDPGFQTARVLTVQIGLPNNTSPGQVTQFYSGALQRIRGLPGVTAAGGVSNLFFLNETRTHALRQVEGHAPEAKSAWTPLVWAQVTGHYFEAMGIRLERGRFFDDRDSADAPPVAIINETLAARYWPHADPIGKHLKGFDPRGSHDDWLTVVGVVADTRSAGLERAPISQIYEVQAQRGEQIGSLVVRTSNTTKLAASIREVLHQMNPDVTVASIATMEQLLGRQQMQRRFQTWVVSMFSAIALVLALFGVFAAMHYSVAARRSEIGIRIAVGARPGDVLLLVIRSGARIALWGVLAGSVAAIWLVQLISSMLYGVRPTDPISIAAAAGSLLMVAVLGSYGPALAASRVDPISSLRQE